MKIYVAAPWTHKTDAKNYADALEAAGHTITKKWWEHREVPSYLDPAISIPNREELIQQAAEDISGVLEAEALVLLNLAKSEGKAVETGVAVLSALLHGNGITISGVSTFILVGGKSNLFHYLPFWEEASSPEDTIAILSR